jgi:outer membrane protein assembly factor BamB/predicted phosphodiesterase
MKQFHLWRIGGRKPLGALLACLALLCAGAATAAVEPFRFAWLSDTHVGSGTGAEDLRASVRDLNAQTGLAFVVISGDVTEYGSLAQFQETKAILADLKLPCHLIPGNHDTKWSESGGTDFARLWGADRFTFEQGGVRFIGLHQGPLLRMGDGHFAPQDVRWLEATLAALPDKSQPLVFVTHYPLDNGIANWFVVLDRLKQFNTQVVLVGHGHSNRKLGFEGVPGVMGRSNLRARAAAGAYTLVEVQPGEMTFAERAPGGETKPPWHSVKLGQRDFTGDTNQWPRPDFSVNVRHPNVKVQWQVATGWTIAAAPCVAADRAILGDASGTVRALRLTDGQELWQFKAGGAVLATADAARGVVVFGATDGSIHGLDVTNGRPLWQVRTARPVVAAPRIDGAAVLIGGSDGKFRALELRTGTPLWTCEGLKNFVEARPLLAEGKVIFGAWDTHLRALSLKTGEPVWTWTADKPAFGFSPAACWPVAAKGKVFIVAPDRVMTAIDLANGAQVWRTNRWQVRESIGRSEDGERIYVRLMNDQLVALSSRAPTPEAVWELDAKFGYDINPAALVEKAGVLFYGTKNGLLLAVDGKTGRLNWQHKLGDALLNTVAPLSAKQVLVTDFDGQVSLVTAD